MNFSAKWDFLAKNAELVKAIRGECASYSNAGGGLICLKYETDAEDEMPMWVFIPRSAQATWLKIKSSITNFEELERDYDPHQHCLMLMALDTNNSKTSAQLVRIPLNQEEDLLEIISEESFHLS